MDLSIVIITWNSERFIDHCVRSIVQSIATSSLSYEIHVVDNGSTDGTRSLLEKLSREHPGLLVLHPLEKNLGTTVSRNIALKRSRGKHICIMDSDVEVRGEVFTTLVALLEEDRTVGLAVPRILYPSGRLQKSCDRFPTLFRKLYRFFRLRAIEEKEERDQKEPAGNLTVDYAISAFWLLRREVLEKVGLLDERIFYSPEDVDFCLRIWKGGYRVLYHPLVCTVHHTQEISRGWKINRAKLSHILGLFYLFRKHRYFFRAPSFTSRVARCGVDAP